MSITYDIVGESHDLKFIPATMEESVGGYRILGKVEGQHFHPNGLSRNVRYYPEELWQNVVHKDEAVKGKLKNRTMFGTIGHDTEITEKELREGVPSHITTYLSMNENGVPGFARTEILDTKTGQTLKAYLEAGVNLYVSSRADGEYIPNQFFTSHEGKKAPIMNPKTYKLERFDFVLQPGFLTANPKLQEAFYESLTPEALEVHQLFLEADKSRMGMNGVQDKSPDVKDLNKRFEEPQTDSDLGPNQDPTYQSNATTDYPKDADDLLYDPPTGEYNTSSSKVGTTVIKGVKDDDTQGGQNIRDPLGDPQGSRDDATQGGINSPANDSDGSRNTVSNDTNQNVNSQSKQATKGTKMTKQKESVDEVSQLDILLSENEALRIENEATAKKLAEAQEALAYATKAREFFEKVGQPTQIVERLQSAIEFHQRIGTYEQIEANLVSFKEFVEVVGDPTEVQEALEATIAFNEKYAPESIAKLMDEAGTAEEILAALEATHEFFEKAGLSGDQMLEKVQTLQSFEQQFGEVWTVGSKLERVAVLDREISARRVSEDCSVDYDKVIEKLNSGLNESQIREFYTALNTGLTDIAVFSPRTTVDTGKMTEQHKPLVAQPVSAVRRVLEGLN